MVTSSMSPHLSALLLAVGKLKYVDEAEEIAFNAIKGSNRSDTVVLGKFDDGGPTAYSTIAQETGSQYFELDN